MPRTALAFAFFLSGAAGLIFQVVWFYRSGLVFGNSTWAVALVLSSFMCGLALGGALAGRYASGSVKRLLMTYAGLEITIGLSGVVVAALLPNLTAILVPLLRGAGEQAPLANAIRLCVAFVVLVVPATAMGATLPVLVGALSRKLQRSSEDDSAVFGRALGRLYGWNTLGAMAGVVVAETLLIDRIGVTGAALTAAGLCACAAATAISVSRSMSPGDAPAPSPSATRRKQAVAFQVRRWPLLLVCAFITGGSLLALEVIWFRFLTMYVLSTTLAMSLMLAVVLAAIGAGSLTAAAWLRRRPAAAAYLPWVAVASGCSVIVSYVWFQQMTAGIQVGEWFRVLWFASVISVPTSFLSGVLFTLTGEALQQTANHVRTAGWLVVANTVGAMLGPLVAIFLLLPAVGMEGSFALITTGYGVVALFAWAAIVTPRATVARVPVPALAGGTILVVTLAAFPFGLMRDGYFLRVAQAYAGDGSQIVATREGPTETIFLMRQSWIGQRIYDRLVTNGFSMSGTEIPGMRYMRYFAYWPMLLHEGPLRRVLVICFGVGTTLDAVTDIPSVDSIDLVEISSDILATSDLIYAADQHPLRDPRVRTHVEDGRHFLETSTERYDLITGEPPPPRTPGAVTLYTREYFRLVYDRLADGGMTTYWLPVARPDPGTDVDTIIRAFCDVFEDCSLWNATPFDLMLVGTRGARGPRGEAEFTAAWRGAHLAARLREVGFEQPEQIGATFLGDADYLRTLTANTPALTDDFPHRLEPVAARPSLSAPRTAAHPTSSEHYQSVIDPGRAREAFSGSAFIQRLWPPSLIERTLPFFEHQRTINRVFWEGGRPLRQIEDLHEVLTQTTLRTLPLWILGTDDVKQQIAGRVDDGSGAVSYSRGLSALAARNYQSAMAWFIDAERRGLVSPNVRALQTYALCATGRTGDAQLLAGGIQPAEADELHFWSWVGPACGAGPFRRGSVN